MRACCYGPQTQQCLTRDPIEALDQPYAYANRNPVNYIDPSGTDPEDNEFPQGGRGSKAPTQNGSTVPGGGGGTAAAYAYEGAARRGIIKSGDLVTISCLRSR
jgi:hypothetical protein